MTMVKVNNRPALRTFNGLVNELFNDFETTVGAMAKPLNHHLPAVNILENAEGYHAELLAPGRKKENFSLSIENGELTIGYNEEKSEVPAEVKLIRREFSIGGFKRSFAIDETIDTGSIQAKYEDGLLKIFLPKKAEVKPHTFNIQIQ